MGVWPLSLPSWETGELWTLDLTRITQSSYLLLAPVLWTWHSLLLPLSLWAGNNCYVTPMAVWLHLSTDSAFWNLKSKLKKWPDVSGDGSKDMFEYWTNLQQEFSVGHIYLQSRWHLLLISLFKAISSVCKGGWGRKCSALTPSIPRPNLTCPCSRCQRNMLVFSEVKLSYIQSKNLS